MSTISTFSGFTMARLGIMAASKALEVTGNNISNINTPGYTRQALDQRALYIGGADRYASQFDVRVGSGALTTGVSQLRDPYLDIRYRNEAANVGFYDAKGSVLESLSLIFDEVGKGTDDNGVIEAQISDLLEQLQHMNTEHAGEDAYDTNVRKSAESLVEWFNTYAGQLETLYEKTEKNFKADIGEINNILTSIRELNESIKKAEIGNGALGEAERKEGMIGERGQQALELRDQRNMLIDRLSEMLPIDVKYSDEPIGAGMTVEKLTITLSGNSNAVLVDGIYCSQMATQQVEQPVLDADGNPVNPPQTEMVDDPYYRLQLSVLKDRRGEKKPRGIGSDDPNSSQPYPLKLGDQDITSGSIQAKREMLTKQGEYSTNAEVAMDPKAATKRGIKFYQKTLDALANKIATIFNQANTTDKDGNSLLDAAGNPILGDDGKPLITGTGNLFSNSGDSNDATGITAKNIAISIGWAHGDISIIQTRDPANNHLTTANDNIVHLIAAMQGSYEYRPSDLGGQAGTGDNDFKSDSAYFTGNFHGMLSHINNLLGGDMKSTVETLDNYIVAAQELDMSRDSVSGVDLNDEAMNMMQFQKAYSASCRLLTTLDEILEKLINGTGIAGR